MKHALCLRAVSELLFAIEYDVHQTSDREAIVFNDDAFKRLTDIDSYICN